ncbi:MAG TPA: tRNA lysidine(34) synthetase TilS [Steroidobacteraceae bacterium]
MHKRSLDELPQLLAQWLPAGASGDVLVALSGGLDSTVLLHALAPSYRSRHNVRVVHVHHGLHSDAERWEAECARQAQALGLEFVTRRVRVPDNPPEGLESAARRARYDVLREMLRPKEALLTAHHADDQLETVLLALMRGSGVEGLAAMPRCQPFGAGWHVRPLLEWTRDEIEEWARARGLNWSHDPSNDSTRFDRNYLRAHIVPGLRARWPSAAHSVVRSAAHLGDAAQLLEEIAARDFADASHGPCLRVAALERLSSARRRNLLRYWLRAYGARAPSTRKLASLEHDMLAAEDDRLPCVAWDDVEVRRHRGLLYCGPKLAPLEQFQIEWEWRTPLKIGALPGILRAQIAHGRGLKRSALPSCVQVRARRGGERLRLPQHAHRRELKKLLQDASVLPWWRDRLPLVFVGDTLIAVADLWIEASFAAGRDEEGVEIVWEGRPSLTAMK